jgi:hypothetical protein
LVDASGTLPRRANPPSYHGMSSIQASSSLAALSSSGISTES